MMITHQAFVASIEAFLAAQGMKATAFGRAAVGDPNLVGDLRGSDGKEPRMPSLRLVERVNKFMSEYASKQETAA